MCRQPSPGGHLVCANPTCNGRVPRVGPRVVPRPDMKRDLDARDDDA